jgi:hypothetical protein
MAPPGRQKPKKASKVFFAGWIPGINSYSDIRQEMQSFSRISVPVLLGESIINSLKDR